MPAIEQLISEGRCINVTLMFSMKHYEASPRPIFAASKSAPRPDSHSTASLRSRAFSSAGSKRWSISASTASLKVASKRSQSRRLRGTAAVANAKLIYQRFKEIFHSDQFKPLAAKGAHVQRPLWASTGTKNPDYSDIKYIQELIGPETVNTMPPATMDAYRDHGDPKATLDTRASIRRAMRFKRAGGGYGIDLDEVGEELQKEGVDSFIKSFEELMASDQAPTRLIKSLVLMIVRKVVRGPEPGCRGVATWIENRL